MIPLQILKQLNRPDEAVIQLSWALNLSRHGSGGNVSSHIREEIDQIYHNLDEGQEENVDFIVHSDPEDDGSDVSMQDWVN